MRRACPRLLLVCAVLGVLRCGSSAAGAAEDRALAALSRMTPVQRVGQVLLVAFYVPDALHDSGDPLAEVRGLVRDLGVGGVVLQKGNNVFRNVRGEPLPEEIAALTGDLQQAALASDAGGVPLFIAVDHEGDGDPLTHLREGFTPVPSAMAIGATFDPAAAETVGRVVGSELAAVGVNMLLGPVLDVLADPRVDSGGDIGTRSFGGDPYWVQQLGAAYIRGAHEGSGGRLAVVAKHFPGHGGSDRSTDNEAATVNKSIEALREIELQPFAAVTSASPGDPEAPHVADALMTSHIRYRAVRPDIRSLTPPISFDREALEVVLDLEGLPFRAWRDAGGLIVADSLGVRAVRRTFDPTESTYPHRQIARQALIAGNDLLIVAQFAADGSWHTMLENVRDLVGYFAEQTAVDPALRDRIDEAALRVLRRKAAIYPDWSPSEVVVDPASARELVGTARSGEQVADVARAAVTELRAVDRPRAGDTIAIVADFDRAANPRELACYGESCGLGSDRAERFSRAAPTLLEALLLERFGPTGTGAMRPDALRLVTFCQLRELLRPSGTVPAAAPGEGPTLRQPVCDPDAEPTDVRRTLGEADWILFAFAELDPTEVRDLRGLLLPQAAAIAAANEGARVAALALGPPYYVDQTNFYHLDTYVAAYSKVPASIDAAVAALWGDGDAPGALPVTYPDGNMPLHERLAPDPDQRLAVRLVAGPDAAWAPAALTAEVGPVRDRNGNVVPDGTEVTFATDPADALSRAMPFVVGTSAGIGHADLVLVSGTRVRVLASSGSAVAEPVEVVLEPPPTPTAQTSDGDAAAPGGPEAPTISEASRQRLRVSDLLLSLAAIVFALGLPSVRGARSGAPLELRLREGLLAAVFGLAAYLTYGVGLLTSRWPRPSALPMGTDAVAITVFGAVVGVAVALAVTLTARRTVRTPREEG